MFYSKVRGKTIHRTCKKEGRKKKQKKNKKTVWYPQRIINSSVQMKFESLGRHYIIERLNEEVADKLWILPSSLGRDRHVFLIISNDNRRPQIILFETEKGKYYMLWLIYGMCRTLTLCLRGSQV